MAVVVGRPPDPVHVGRRHKVTRRPRMRCGCDIVGRMNWIATNASPAIAQMPLMLMALLSLSFLLLYLDRT